MGGAEIRGNKRILPKDMEANHYTHQGATAQAQGYPCTLRPDTGALTSCKHILLITPVLCARVMFTCLVLASVRVASKALQNLHEEQDAPSRGAWLWLVTRLWGMGVSISLRSYCFLLHSCVSMRRSHAKT